MIAQIKNRNYKFIIYMDDLSFEEFEIEYKYLKAVIEGGLEKKPDNILIYATSNRRHLVREKSSDKLEIMDDDDLHSSDTVQEKLSLVYRFGVRIYYGAPGKKDSRRSSKRLRKETELPCRRMNCFWKQISGNFPMAVLQEELHSSLLIICWEKLRSKKYLITILLPVKYGSKKKVMKLSEIWGIRFYRYQLR